MTSNIKALQITEKDVSMLLACKAHLGTKNLTVQMSRYVYGRRRDGIHVLNLGMLWEKLVLAARIIVSIKNPADVCVHSSRPFAQRAALKYSQVTGATLLEGRFTPGTFTNQIQSNYREPRLLLVADPRADHQPVQEAAYVSIPTISFCSSDSPLKYVDCAIPCNNAGKYSLGLMFWLLAREVMRMRGALKRTVVWSVKIDLFFFKDADEIKKLQEAKEAAAGGTAATTTMTTTATKTMDFGVTDAEGDWAEVNPRMGGGGGGWGATTYTAGGTDTHDWSGEQWGN